MNETTESEVFACPSCEENYQAGQQDAEDELLGALADASLTRNVTLGHDMVTISLSVSPDSPLVRVLTSRFERLSSENVRNQWSSPLDKLRNRKYDWGQTTEFEGTGSHLTVFDEFPPPPQPRNSAS